MILIILGQIHGIVDLLIKKTNHKNQLNLEICECVNTEELALSHIYIVLIVLFEYDNIKNQELKNNDIFDFYEWIQEIQNNLSDFNKNLKGW